MPPPSFDRIARPYRLLEHLTLGRALTRTRLTHLPALPTCRRALVLGDGDGRFLADLLRIHPSLAALAIDSSRTMLHLLRRRCAFAGPRLTTRHSDALYALAHLPATPTFDLAVTHFFLDCFTTAELHRLIPAVRSRLAPGALWLLSDFRIPPAGPLRLPARLVVRLLYAAFRLLTGLRPTRLPDHVSALSAAGLRPLHLRHRLGGLLTAELWRLPPASNSHGDPMDPNRTDRAPIEPVYDIDMLTPIPPAPIVIPGETEREIRREAPPQQPAVQELLEQRSS